MNRIEVCLYYYHDFDLLPLYQEGRIRFTEAVRLSLNAYAKKEYFRFEMNEVPERKLKYRAVYRFMVSFDPQKDCDALSLLSQISPGYRNSFIKTILRQYIGGYISSNYLKEKEKRNYFDERYLEMGETRSSFRKIPRGYFTQKKKNINSSEYSKSARLGQHEEKTKSAGLLPDGNWHDIKVSTTDMAEENDGHKDSALTLGDSSNTSYRQNHDIDQDSGNNDDDITSLFLDMTSQ